MLKRSDTDLRYSVRVDYLITILWAFHEEWGSGDNIPKRIGVLLMARKWLEVS